VCVCIQPKPYNCTSRRGAVQRYSLQAIWPHGTAALADTAPRGGIGCPPLLLPPANERATPVRLSRRTASMAAFSRDQWRAKISQYESATRATATVESAEAAGGSQLAPARLGGVGDGGRASPTGRLVGPARSARQRRRGSVVERLRAGEASPQQMALLASASIPEAAVAAKQAAAAPAVIGGGSTRARAAGGGTGGLSVSKSDVGAGTAFRGRTGRRVSVVERLLMPCAPSFPSPLPHACSTTYGRASIAARARTNPHRICYQYSSVGLILPGCAGRSSIGGERTAAEAAAAAAAAATAVPITGSGLSMMVEEGEGEEEVLEGPLQQRTFSSDRTGMSRPGRGKRNTTVVDMSLQPKPSRRPAVGVRIPAPRGSVGGVDGAGTLSFDGVGGAAAAAVARTTSTRSSEARQLMRSNSGRSSPSPLPSRSPTGRRRLSPTSGRAAMGTVEQEQQV
jgi:hypothetical protein